MFVDMKKNNMGMKSAKNKRWTEIDRTKQFILGGVVVKDIRRLHKQRMDNRLRQTLVVYIDTPPGPGASRKKLNEAIRGLRVYGKGANKNKLVIRRLFWTRLRFKSCYSKGWVSPGLDKLPHRTPKEIETARVTTKERKVELDSFPTRLSEPMNLRDVKRRHETL